MRRRMFWIGSFLNGLSLRRLRCLWMAGNKLPMNILFMFLLSLAIKCPF
jgi:hypothetical protein